MDLAMFAGMPHPAVTLEVYGQSDVGRVRATNEDAFIIEDLTLAQPMDATRAYEIQVGERGVLLAVSDGMGGARAGDLASALTLQSLRRGMAGRASSAEAALQASVEKANQRVFNASEALGRGGMGATITALLVYGHRAYVAEVGDSRAYVLRNDRLVQVTHDQSYAQLMIDAGTLTREEAETFPYKNVIAQAIGTQQRVVVAMTRFNLRRKDRLLLCSDGLSSTLDDAEITKIIARTSSLNRACKALVDAANAKGGQDNITVVLAEVDGEGLPVSIAGSRVSVDTLQEFTGGTS